MIKTIWWVQLLTLLFGAFSSLRAQDFLTNGLVAYYPFTGNANDASGSGNDGIVNGAVLTNDRFGIASSAYGFSALGQGITTSQANGFPTSTNDFTVSLWVRVTSNSTHQVFLSNQDFEQFNIHIGPIQSSRTGIGFQAGGTGAGYTTNILWSLGRWYNVQVVRAQNTNIMIYRDGVQLSQQTSNLGNDAPLSQRILTFGYNPTYSPVIQQLYGALDDIRIYNRALSPLELQDLYRFELGPRIALLKAVQASFFDLSVGKNYQLQVSDNYFAWTNHGAAFAATNTVMMYPTCFDVADWGQLFFRLQVSP